MLTDKCIIIAEAGVNHNGNIAIAKQLIDVATKAGVDFIKFQTFITELVISKNAEKANYQKKNTRDKIESQFEMIKKLELSFEDFIILKDYCKEKRIGFLSTGYDFPSIDFLDDLGQPFFKIPSGEINNKPFLKHIAKKGKRVILSTGMANMTEIKAAIDVFIQEGLNLDQIIVLHCSTEYPTPLKDVNLRAMQAIGKAFNVKIGYSDHTLGIVIPIAAVALGAVVIEKHFTLDRKMYGPDHKASLEPDELEKMVKAIRNIEEALGDGIKKPSLTEVKNISVVRKSLHYARNLPKGYVLSDADMAVKRPGNGISPMDIDKLVSRTLIKNVSEDTQVKWEDFL